jgi:hypothetical protein
MMPAAPPRELNLKDPANRIKFNLSGFAPGEARRASKREFVAGSAVFPRVDIKPSGRWLYCPFEQMAPASKARRVPPLV